MHAQRAPLPGKRWHFQHGPIDIVIGAEGDATALAAAHEAAWARFETVLPELVSELRALRLPVRGPCPLQGVIARRMWHACRPHHAQFITPMAAVAGAVAQELIAAYARDGIRRAWVNNGGDIALHLSPGAAVKVGLLADLARFDPAAGDPHLDADFEINANMPVRGIATSGWRGRSFSLGIADAVTVLASDASGADAAATLIANAVDLPGHPAITRVPAVELQPDSDLGRMLVTRGVGPLPDTDIDKALGRGVAFAQMMVDREVIVACALHLSGETRIVGNVPINLDRRLTANG